MDRAQASLLIESLYREWGPCLVRHAYRLTSDREAADDLVQESFMALYQACRRGEEVENPRGWTLAVVRNLAARRFKDRARRGESLKAPEEMAGYADPRTPVGGDEELDVTGLFSVLSRREEEVVLMRIESQKYREIAVTLGISQKTVETLLARALRKLRDAAKNVVEGRMTPASAEKHVPKTLQ